MKEDQSNNSSKSFNARENPQAPLRGQVITSLNTGEWPLEVIPYGRESAYENTNGSYSLHLRNEVPSPNEVDSAGQSGIGGVTRAAHSLARRAVLKETEFAVDDSSSLPGTVSPAGGDIQKLQRLMRGRYFLCIMLAALFGGAGAWCGFKLGYKTYQSTGLITITPIRLFSSPDGNQSTEQFMLAETAKLRSQRVMDSALDDPAWKSLGRVRTDAIEAEFARDLGVSQQGQTLLITFTDRDPQAAAVAVQTTMKSFKRLFETEQSESGVFAQQQWISARADLSAKAARSQQRIDDISGIYGAGGLAMRRDIKLQELQEVEKGTAELDLLQAQLLAAPPPKTAPTPSSDEDSVEAIARVDTLTSNLLSRKLQLTEELAELKAGGALDMNPKVKSEAALLNILESELTDHVADWRASHPKGSKLGLQDPLSGNYQSLTPEAVRARASYLKARKGVLEGELAKLGESLGEIGTVKAEMARYQRDLDTAEEELQQGEIQKTNWRIDVNDADRPLTAFRDTRVTFAGTGGLGGIFSGFGIVLLIGLMDRRVRDSRDAVGEFAGSPVLGMLPQLPDDLADPDQAAAAAHCVHEVRTQLQIRQRGQNRRVFGITSSAAGTGKTSLTLALGVSFATAKLKTLMIDCDLVGGGLTRRVDLIIHRKIGQILTGGGYITDAQLEQALKLARGSGRRLGEILVELGQLSEADLGHAITRQAEEPVGLPEALAGEDLTSSVAETGIPGLSILPLGSATPEHAGTLSPAALGRVIENARQRYDIVLVDTGPIPGSLEASVSSSQVDAVVLAVARGDRAPDVQQSIRHLRSLGTPLAGIVFNRAEAQDMERYGSSRFSSGETSGSSKSRRGEAVASARLGPMARAVASFVPEARGNAMPDSKTFPSR
jgi:Mrp family chromosome partitioning ATPase